MSTAVPPIVHSDRKGHIVELQSIRGIAAAVVLIGHSLNYFEVEPWFGRYKDMVNGHSSVVIFFVLSGFVLTQSLMDKPATLDTTLTFYVRRVFRIYPAIWIASLVGLIYLLFFHYRIPVGDKTAFELSRFRPDRMKPFFIIASLAGVFTFLLPQLWTVFVELIASVIMPPMAFLARRRRALFWALAVLLGVGSFTLVGFTPFAVGVYLVDFAIGAAICVLPEAARRLFRMPNWAATVCLVVLAIVLLQFRLYFDVKYDDPLMQLIEAVCAAAIISFFVHGGATVGVLCSKPMSFLGDISYSLYLLHYPVLCFVAMGEWLVLQHFGLHISGVLMAVIVASTTFVVTIPLASLSYTYVEKPGIRVGSSVVRKLKQMATRRQGLEAPVQPTSV